MGHWHYLWHFLLSQKNSVVGLFFYFKAFGLLCQCFKGLLERHGIYLWERVGGSVDISVVLFVIVFLQYMC